MSGECEKCGEHILDCKCADRKKKRQTFQELLRDASYLYQDQPKEVGKLIYWALTLDEEARYALIMAYRLMNDKE